MLPILLSSSVSYAPQLVVGLVICGIAALTISNLPLATTAFLVQRLMVITLLWPSLKTPLRTINLITLGAIAAIYYITEWHRRSDRSRSSFPNPLFKALTAALGLLLARGLVQTWLTPSLPMVAFTVSWLIIAGLLIILLTDGALRTGLGILTFADGCRVLYALWEPSPLVWALWSIGDVLVALAASHLCDTKAAIGKSQTDGGGK